MKKEEIKRIHPRNSDSKGGGEDRRGKENP